jgi:Adenylate and Guanylate cyclase catalytic domain
MTSPASLTLLVSFHMSLYLSSHTLHTCSGVRVGIHSGPVTAGVLRGERSRFQLFGDTMNTAARIEQTGAMNRIHVSQATSNLLNKAGKGYWMKACTALVEAKGKGMMQTFWAKPAPMGATYDDSGITVNDASRTSDTSQIEDSLDDEASHRMSGKLSRLIDWNVDILQKLIKQILCHRQAARVNAHRVPPLPLVSAHGRAPLDEVVEIIALPEFDAIAAKTQVNPEEIVLSDKVTDQLRFYISAISMM